jgi:hypothetical protein
MAFAYCSGGDATVDDEGGILIAPLDGMRPSDTER